MTEHQFPLISDAYQAFLLDAQARHLTPRTIEYYHHSLGPFIAFCGRVTLDSITRNTIRKFLAHKAQQGLAGYTLLGHARAIRAFCNFCVREEWIDVSPMAKVRMPRVERREPHVYTPKQIKVILRGCLTPRDRAIVLYLLDTGIRAAELLKLNICDVDMERGKVSVIQGKGRKDRTVYLGATARKALWAYLMTRKRRKDLDPLWLSERGSRLTTSGLRQALRRIGKRAGVHCTAHSFRRTFATMSLRAGMDIYTLQRLMGHADITVLKYYVALSGLDLEAAQRRYGVVDNLP